VGVSACPRGARRSLWKARRMPLDLSHHIFSRGSTAFRTPAARANPTGTARRGGGQQRAAAAPIAAGHADYPSFRFMFPDPRRRAKVLPVFFEATVRDAIPYGAVLAATHGDRVDATAVWLPPGRFPWTLRRKLRAAPAFARVMVAAPRSFRMFMRFGGNMEATHRDEQHWYLVVLGSARMSAARTRVGSRRADPRSRRPRRPALLARDLRSRQRRVLPTVRLRGHRPRTPGDPRRSPADHHATTARSVT
jgi:hypothetical protein